MAAAFASLLADLEASVARGGFERRNTLLRRLTNLFADESPRLGEEQVSAFDTVILHLASDVEDQARIDLSERLADLSNAPLRVVRNLAFDPLLAVAHPVLARSQRIVEGDLETLASKRGRGHLHAMAGRAVLSPSVADILVARGDTDVARLVAGNPGARLSLNTFTALGDRAFRDAELATRLQTRADLPTSLRARLTSFAKARAAEPLPVPLSAARSEALLAAEVYVSTQARRADLDENVLIGWLKSGRETEALVALARLAGIPSQMALDAYETDGYEAFLPIVRSLRFGWRILSGLFTAKTGQEPPPEMMHDVMQAFQSLSVVSAQAKVRATAARYKRS